MKLTLPLAASSGAETDYLLLGLGRRLGRGAGPGVRVDGLLYVIRYRHDSPIDRGALAEKSFRFEIILDHRDPDRVLWSVHLGLPDLRPALSAARAMR